MKDSDPRPMPRPLRIDYRDPTQLEPVLSSSVYSDHDRTIIKNAVLDALIFRYGVADSPVDSERSIRDEIEKTHDIRKAIEIILGVEEYGGKEEVLPLLAEKMEPQWNRWWNTRDWGYSINDPGQMSEAMGIIENVLSTKQLGWIAAQCARRTLRQMRGDYRPLCVEAIECVEGYCLGTRSLKYVREFARALVDLPEELRTAYMTLESQGALAAHSCCLVVSAQMATMIASIADASVGMAASVLVPMPEGAEDDLRQYREAPQENRSQTLAEIRRRRDESQRWTDYREQVKVATEQEWKEVTRLVTSLIEPTLITKKLA